MTDHSAFTWVVDRCLAANDYTYAIESGSRLSDERPGHVAEIYGELAKAGAYGTPWEHDDFVPGLQTAEGKIVASFTPGTPHRITTVLRQNHVTDSPDYHYLVEAAVDGTIVLLDAAQLVSLDARGFKTLEVGSELKPGESLFINGVAFCDRYTLDQPED